MRRQLNVGRFTVAEIACASAVPPHFDCPVDLDHGAKLFGVYAGYALTNQPGGAVHGRDRIGHGRLSLVMMPSLNVGKAAE